MVTHREALWRRIHASLLQRLASGSLLPGMRLSSEAAMAREWSCSRQAVRSALLRLAEEGKLRRRVGRGWFVAEARSGGRQRARIACINGLREAASSLFADHDLLAVDYQPPQGIDSSPSAELAAAIIAEEDISAVMLTAMRPVDPTFLHMLKDAGRQLVIIGLAGQAPCDVVSCDFAAASAAMVHQAHAQGCRRIAFYGRHLHAELAPFQARVHGYLNAMHERGLSPQLRICPSSLYRSEDVSSWYCERFRQRPADAVILDVQPSAQVIAGLHALAPIPDHLVVAGYGNGVLPPDIDLPIPALDAVYEPWDDLHACAAHRLLARLDGDESRPSHSLVSCDLIVGGSGLLSPKAS